MALATYVVIIAIYWLGVRASNGLIVRILKKYQPEKPLDDSKKNAGFAIGILERILIIAFILLDQFGVVGWIIAGKALARHKLLEEKDKAEYFLIGTLLSFSVALLTALIIKTVLDLNAK